MSATSPFNTGYIFLISFISAIGGYLFGFDFAVISGALPFLKEQFGLDAYWEGFTTGSLALGCMGGCIFAGRMSGKYGRKPALMMSGIFFCLSSLAMALAPTLGIFIGARFVAGIGVGMASMLSPMYIAEISPAPLRGRMVSVYQLTIVIGILVTNLVNYSLRNAGIDAWRWMFGLGVAPSAIFCIGVLSLPESPRWLIRAGKQAKAMRVLGRIGGPGFAESTSTGIAGSLSGEEKTSYALALRKPFFAAVLTGTGLAVLQQFCGINVVFNYTTSIFESIGFSKDDQLGQTVIIGIVNVLFTFLAMGLVDKTGRKPLMFTGYAGLAVLYIAISGALQAKSGMSGLLLFAAIGLYASTLAPVTWILISEIFPNKIREAATTIAVVGLWASYFVLTFTFPILSELLGGVANTFYIYAGICLLGACFVFIRIRETKGRTLEEMEGVFTH